MFNKEYNRKEYTDTQSSSNFMSKVYGLMAGALAITASVAYFVSSTPAVFKAIVNSPLVFVLFLAQIGLVLFLTWKIKELSYAAAVTSFLAYSALSGITFSVYFYIYTAASIYLAFAITSGMFLAMAAYGYFTKSDLSAMGSFLVMGLIGITIAMFANMFFQSPIASYYISLLAVGIFTLLTAYDVQKIKNMLAGVAQEDKNKVVVLGALTLYLDFINLFIHLLRILGKKKD